MLLGRVIGKVVSCEIHEGLEAVPMLWIQPLDKFGKAKGHPIVAADATRMAGQDEVIYFEGGREAAMTLDPSFVPVDHAVIGIVDNLNVEGSEL